MLVEQAFQFKALVDDILVKPGARVVQRPAQVRDLGDQGLEGVDIGGEGQLETGTALPELLGGLGDARSLLTKPCDLAADLLQTTPALILDAAPQIRPLTLKMGQGLGKLLQLRLQFGDLTFELAQTLLQQGGLMPGEIRVQRLPAVDQVALLGG
ncbi:hypothetical protein D3C72_1330250 [compost metagenome]